jgi:predicted acyltransferase
MNMTAPAAPRIASLDQFRGYTVAGMLLVNFIGRFDVTPAILKHHNTYCSYADTIMPQFFFAVGFAYRLTLLRRLKELGRWSPYNHVLTRNLGLILFGIVFYHLDGEVRSWTELTHLGWRGFFGTAFLREPFQALVHIGVTSLWVLPVIAARPSVRVMFLVASAAIHLALSKWSYFDWVWNRPGIDGGPLGFLTWTVPLLVGSLAFDAVGSRPAKQTLGLLIGWGAILMIVGYAMSSIGPLSAGSPDIAGSKDWHGLAAPPFVPPTRPVDLWTMSQRAGTASYLTFSAGFALVVYALFVVVSDLGSLRIGLFRTFGKNALAAYVLHSLVAGAVGPYAPKDSPFPYAVAMFLLYFGLSYLFVRHLEKNGIFIRM